MAYSHLNKQERYVIYHLCLYGLSYREIGRRLDRHHSTIQREVCRNKLKADNGPYIPERGAHRYRLLRSLPQHRKRKSHQPLHDYVYARLKQRWSREQISGRLKKDFPRDAAMRLSVQSIYNWIYQDAQQQGVLYQNLRLRHKKRRKQRRLGGLRGMIKDRVSITLRPLIVESRRRFGDWKSGDRKSGDTIPIGNRGTQYLLIDSNHRFC